MSDSMLTIKDFKVSNPRWCAGCGDYMILVGLRKFFAQRQMEPSSIVNVSGIGCSGRIPHYLNTYGLHSIHGRAIPIALGVALMRPDLQVFIESGDGDALSIGGNHLIHGITKNFNCVFILFDNQIYGLTKSQTSPTTQKGYKTTSHPDGSEIEPLYPIRLALSLGATFVASTAEWLGAHMVETIERAFDHKGFSFVHVAQRCPKYNPDAWNDKESNWITFLEHENGVAADTRIGKDASVVQHDPSDLDQAYLHAGHGPTRFGLFYQTQKATYDDGLRAMVTDDRDRASLLDDFVI